MKSIGESVKDFFKIQKSAHEIAARQLVIAAHDSLAKGENEKAEKQMRQSKVANEVSKKFGEILEGIEKKEPGGLQSPGS